MSRNMCWVFGGMMCLGLISCNLFKTRTPQEPTQVSSNNVPATDASLVFQNMIYAFQEGNAFNYSQVFSDSLFDFVASGKALNGYGGELINWNKAKEQQYFNKVINSLPKNSKVLLEFITVSSTDYSDSSEFVKTYIVQVPSSIGGLVKEYKGQAQFTLGRDPLKGSWNIRRWADYELNPTDSTWSDLKGSFAN